MSKVALFYQLDVGDRFKDLYGEVWVKTSDSKATSESGKTEEFNDVDWLFPEQE